MPVVLHRSTISEGPGYEVLLIDYGKQLWIGLVESLPKGALAFWSTKSSEREHAAYDVIVDELTKRLALVHRGEENIYDALMFWPTGWDYWGQMIPLPIDNYVSSWEFRRQFSRWNNQVRSDDDGDVKRELP